MEPQFYYIRQRSEADVQNHWKGVPIVTVCLLRNDQTGVWSRGVSVCSPLDNVCKRHGRFKAQARAERAMQGCIPTDRPYCQGTDWRPFLDDVIFDTSDLRFRESLLEVLEVTLDEFDMHEKMPRLGIQDATLTPYEHVVVAKALEKEAKARLAESTEAQNADGSC